MLTHTNSDRRITIAASIGTLFEWYNFYLYGVLTKIIGTNFFSGLDESNIFLFSLVTFLVGFLVRPLGGILFGYIGDVYGRVRAFQISMGLMVVSTALVSILPTYTSIGLFSPIALVFLRILQGLALGGEYGAAVCFLAENLKTKRKNFYLAFIQSTASMGLFLALLVQIILRNILAEDFDSYGWRIMFLFSIPMYSFTVFIRENISEELDSFKKITFFNYLKNIFFKENIIKMLFLLFGVTMGQAVIWYVCQFYSLFYLIKILNLKEKGIFNVCKI